MDCHACNWCRVRAEHLLCSPAMPRSVVADTCVGACLSVTPKGSREGHAVKVATVRVFALERELLLKKWTIPQREAPWYGNQELTGGF